MSEWTRWRIRPFALTGAKADERQVLLGIFDGDPSLIAGRPGQILIGDKNYYGHDFEAALATSGLTLLRSARQGEPERPGTRFFKPLRQVIEPVNQAFKPSSTSNDTAATLQPGSSSASCSTCWP